MSQQEDAKPQTLILYAGRDPALLMVRRLLLEHAGYLVTTAATHHAFVEEFHGGDFDGVILCSSIENPERQKMTSVVRRRNPATPVIVIAESSFSHHNFGTVTVDPRPELLLSGVAEVFKSGSQRYPA